METLQNNHLRKLEYYKTIIDDFSFDENIESYAELENHDAKRDKQILSLMQGLKNLEGFMVESLHDIEMASVEKLEIINDDRFLETEVEEELKRLDGNTKTHNATYLLFKRQLHEEKSSALKVIETLEKQKRMARESLRVYLLQQAQEITQSFLDDNETPPYGYSSRRGD
jgi:hypothetical protein